MSEIKGPKKLPLSVTIITLNEEKNLARCLESVSGLASEIIVVDSNSTDKTGEIAKKYEAVFIQNPWPGFGAQKNFAQAKTTQPWILNLDADEALSPALIKELRDFLSNESVSSRFGGGSFPRLSFHLGRYIRHGGWYPNRLARLTHKDCGKWTEPHVHEELQVKQKPLYSFKSDLLHFPFSGIHDQILTNLKFSKLGYEDLKRRGKKFSLTRLLIKTIGKFLETYLWKAGFLDGLPGFVIAVHAAHSVFLKHSYYLEESKEN